MTWDRQLYMCEGVSVGSPARAHPAVRLPWDHALEPWLAKHVLGPAVRRREAELSARALRLLRRDHGIAGVLATIQAAFLFQAPLAMDRFFHEAWTKVRRRGAVATGRTSHWLTAPAPPAAPS